MLELKAVDFDCHNAFDKLSNNCFCEDGANGIKWKLALNA